MLRIHRHQNGIWLSSNEEERFDCCRTARAGMDWRPGVAGVVLWANLNFLFWLSLIQFATTWIGENPLSPWPVALYGVALLMAGLAYFVLTKELIAHQSAGSMLAISIRRDRKGSLSILAYRVAIPLAFVRRWDLLSVLRLGCADVDDPRPTHRESAGQQRVTGDRGPKLPSAVMRGRKDLQEGAQAFLPQAVMSAPQFFRPRCSPPCSGAPQRFHQAERSCRSGCAMRPPRSAQLDPQAAAAWEDGLPSTRSRSQLLGHHVISEILVPHMSSKPVSGQP